MMVSIMTFGKPCSGAKTLGWEHSQRILKNAFEKPWGNIYSTEMFSKMVLDKWR
jgi:hypothetical protein